MASPVLQSAPEPLLPNATRLVISGERRRHGVQVVVDGQPIWLTISQFQILVRLVITRHRRHSGWVRDELQLYPRAIWGLRQALNQADGETGLDFIETG